MVEYTLRVHLRLQLGNAYRGLARSLEGLDETRAREGARADWRRYRWGSGLDGSIAGIVWHAALWKHNFAGGLETGVFPAEQALAPPATDWRALQAWLAEGQTRLQDAFERLSETELTTPREWEGMTEPLARLLGFIIEHDFYHAGQIELLRQLRDYPAGGAD